MKNLSSEVTQKAAEKLHVLLEPKLREDSSVPPLRDSVPKIIYKYINISTHIKYIYLLFLFYIVLLNT